MMKKLRFIFNVFQKTFILLLVVFLANTAVESRSFSNHPVYKNQQTKQSRSSKKIKKKVVKKVINKKKSTPIAQGVWGGTGIGFVVGANGVEIEYDCAEGEIKEKLTTNESGNFSVNGFHKRQTPSIRVDFTPKPQAVIYQGKISGSTMNLKVILTETKEVIGEYVLTRGKTPQIRKCR